MTTPNTSRASWWRRRKARNKSLSQRISSRQEKRLRPKMGLFLDSQENATCDKYPFESRHQHLSTTNCWGRAKTAPKKSCVSKMYQNQSRLTKHQGHLNMRIDQEKISQCCN